MKMIDTRKCYICKFDPNTGRAKGSQSNRTLHWHQDSESGDIWVWCNGSCARGYSLYDYCRYSGLDIAEIFNSKPEFQEAAPNVVNKMDWPKQFLSLSDKRSLPGKQYLETRNIRPTGDLFYDVLDNGIVFPYHFETVLCGAQVRFCAPKDESHKITTVPGTRLSLLFYNFNQLTLPSHTKAIIVTEGAFDAISIQQSLESIYGVGTCPYKVCAISGSNPSAHHIETLAYIKESGIKVIAAPDYDTAGFNMLEKMLGCSTHYAFTEDANIDWNKKHILIKSDEEMADFFISKVKKL